MNRLAKALLRAGPPGRVVRQFEIEAMLGGSRGRRYGVVNRLLAGGELVRLRRGVYLLPDPADGSLGSSLVAANAILPGSYVSFESALAFHGWIPEAVRVCLSACHGRSCEFENTIGLFAYSHVSTRPGCFLDGVESRDTGAGTALVASPLRAVADLAYTRNLKGPAREFLLESMRVDPEALIGIGPSDITALEGSFRSRRVRSFLRSLLPGKESER